MASFFTVKCRLIKMFSFKYCALTSICILWPAMECQQRLNNFLNSEFVARFNNTSFYMIDKF